MKFSTTYLIFIVISGLILLGKCDRFTKDELTKSEELIRTLPKNERAIFLAYSLGQGYMEKLNSHIFKEFPFPMLLGVPRKLEKKFKALPKPKHFVSSLYTFVANNYRLSSLQMFRLVLFKRHCFPHGHCIDLENIGELCCPF